MGASSSEVGKFLVDENVSIVFVPTLTENCIKIRSISSGNNNWYIRHVLLHHLKGLSLRNQHIYRNYLVHQLIKNDYNNNKASMKDSIFILVKLQVD